MVILFWAIWDPRSNSKFMLPYSLFSDLGNMSFQTERCQKHLPLWTTVQVLVALVLKYNMRGSLQCRFTQQSSLKHLN